MSTYAKAYEYVVHLVGKIKLDVRWVFFLYAIHHSVRNIIFWLFFVSFHPLVLILFSSNLPHARESQMTPEGDVTNQYVCLCFFRLSSTDFLKLKLRIFEPMDICFPFSKFVFHLKWKCLPEDSELLISLTASWSQELSVWCFGWIETQWEILSTGMSALRAGAYAFQWALQHNNKMQALWRGSSHIKEPEWENKGSKKFTINPLTLSLNVFFCSFPSMQRLPFCLLFCCSPSVLSKCIMKVLQSPASFWIPAFQFYLWDTQRLFVAQNQTLSFSYRHTHTRTFIIFQVQT